jgi:pantothenate synthetase
LGTRTISFPVRDWKSYVVLDILVEDTPFSVELARFPFIRPHQFGLAFALAFF